jgi:hypothetical protein
MGIIPAVAPGYLRESAAVFGSRSFDGSMKKAGKKAGKATLSAPGHSSHANTSWGWEKKSPNPAE